ncbi:uncharacterized protein LOC128204072 isoform X6 [Mya arenaria]|uniref:uncharacterized protein LOC128204072 isoform X6 n=1 Tax=Mya arenaria TaxID=6604 RepID=UPI0022E87229|nr:uncharacterized protein LOC128204072 isoform X6 [Mya arenaria]
MPPVRETIKFLRATRFLQLCVILAPVGAVLQGVGAFTEYWGTVDLVFGKGHSGLFTGDSRGWPGWLKATQAFETLGFIAAVAALILIVLYVFVPATSGKRIVFILSMVACFIAAGCILLGIIIYGTKMDYNLSWSFALCCIAGIIFAVAGLLLAIDFCKR